MSSMTRAELLDLPVVVDLVTAGKVLGIGRTRAFELARRGEFPVPVLRVGHTYRVPTAALLVDESARLITPRLPKSQQVFVKSQT